MFTQSCGYEAMYAKKSKADYTFSISKILFKGEREINVGIEEKLKNYTSIKKKRDFKIEVKSFSEKIVLTKDAKGDPTSFKITVFVEVNIFSNDKIQSKLKLEKNLKYNNNTNKFDLNEFEKQTKKDLGKLISDKLIYKISKIK